MIPGKKRVVILGGRATIAVRGFEILRKLDCDIPLIVCGEEDPGTDDWRLSLVRAAREAGFEDGRDLIVVRDPHTPEHLARIHSAEPDLLLSLQWRRILRPAQLGVPPLGIVNLHNAPLPLLRGCDPFSWAIHDGLLQMGVSLHQIVDTGVDSGPVLAQRRWQLTPSDTAWSIYTEALSQADALMRKALPEILAGSLAPTPQDPRFSTYHPIGQFPFGLLAVDWTQPAVALSASLRARIFPPFQLPYFHLAGRKVEILGCCAVRAPGARPGAVVSRSPFRVGTGLGAIEVASVQVDGTVLDGAAFATSHLRDRDMIA